MNALAWWLRVVGVIYLFMAFVSIGPKIPIRVEGPRGIMGRIKEGLADARFVVDTWLMFGLYVGAIGLSLLIASRTPEEAIGLAWTIVTVELIGGIGMNIYKLMRGLVRVPPMVWLVIHSIIVASGVALLRGM
jgi:hypothetical protein